MNYMSLSKHDIEVLFYYYNNSITICFDLFDKIEQLQNDLDASNSRVSELANRINKVLEYIDIQFDNNGTISKELNSILKGDSNELK